MEDEGRGPATGDATSADDPLSDGAWIGVLEHALRNSVSGVRMSFSVLKLALGSREHEACSVLGRNLRRLVVTIEQTVAAARLDGDVALDLQLLEVRELLEEIADAVRDDGGRIELDVPEELHVKADLPLLHAALSTLVVAAIEACHDLGRVALRARRDDGVVIEIESEGPPDPPAIAGAIVRRVIALHAGVLTQRPASPRGWVHAVRLPAVAATGDPG